MDEQTKPSITEIFRDYGPFVWRALRYLGIAQADLDDVCQEVFLVAHRKLPEFEGRSSVRTWLYGIAVRTASNHRKRAYHRRERPTDAPPEQTREGSQAVRLERARQRDMLNEALATLDEDKRTVLVLYEIEEVPMSEVADIVGCPLQTAYSRLHKARELVRKAMKQAELRGAAK